MGSFIFILFRALLLWLAMYLSAVHADTATIQNVFGRSADEATRPAISARLNDPKHLVADSMGDIYVAEARAVHKIRHFGVNNATLTTLIGKSQALRYAWLYLLSCHDILLSLFLYC